MSKTTVNLGKALGYAALDAIGAASGPGNRSRTFPTKKEKAKCPKRQRRTRDWLKGE
jgi:hypothetical protein